jgi:hypothetical protein
MENMDKGLKVPKWVLINWPKTPQMPQKISAQIVCPSPKVWDFNFKFKSFIGGRITHSRDPNHQNFVDHQISF